MNRSQHTSTPTHLTAILVILGAVTAAQAADQVVTNNNDSGTGSLRQAIADVHSGGTITFDGNYTITLQSDLPEINKNITIIGLGCKQTIIDGNGTHRAFGISSGGTLTLKHLTVRNGANIENDSGSLTLDGVVLHGNAGYAGGISNSGSGVQLTVLNSTIHDNTAASRGGGIHSSAGTIIIKNSTICNNTSEYKCGAINIEGGTVQVDSCTVVGNKVTGTGRGGAIWLAIGTLSIRNTILANNQDSTGDNDYYHYTGSLTDNGYNFVEVASANFTNGVNNNIVGVDPTGLASTLTYEGGWTPVLKVTAGNIGGANYGSTTETRDQRGYHRKTTEITRGAYQYDGIVARLFFGDWDGGYPTIAGAVAAGSEGDVINIIDTVVKETDITIPKSHAIMGVSTDAQIWGDDEAGTAAGRIFDITGGGVLIKDVTIKYGNVTGQGGGIRNSGTSLELNNCVITDNTSTQDGAGVCNTSSTLSMSRCTVRDNAAGATYYGGGLLASGSASITHSTFSGNSAGQGAGAYFYDGDIRMQDCTICGNTASLLAGGVANSGATVALANCTISENVAVSGTAGGLLNWGGNLGVLNTIVINNTAIGTDDIYVNGGAVYAQNSWYHDVYGSVTTPATASNVTTAYSSGDLLALADNGGSTLTMRLSPAAPAVGAGAFVYYNSTNGYYCEDSNGDYLDAFGSAITPSDPSSDKITTDQRGTTRVAPCTIGAYHQTSPLPVVTTATLSNVASDSADCGGDVTSAGASSVTVRGVCWDTLENPTTGDDKTTDGSGTGAFTSSITGLRPGTTYYVRAYAINGTGTAYGEQEEFTTHPTPPTLTTTPVTNITETTATCGGEFTGDGGRPLTQYGLCWNTTGTPTTAHSTTVHDTPGKSDSGAPSKKANPRFEDTLTGLTEGTTYYVRAYAINKAGTGYGPEQTFKTLGTATAPDLRVSVTSDAATAAIDQEMSFKVNVKNVGSAPATGVILRVPLPPNTEFIGASRETGGTADSVPLDARAENGVILINLGSVQVSDDLKLALILRAKTTGTVTLEASLTSAETATPATARADNSVAVGDRYYRVVQTFSPFNLCGLAGLATPLMIALGIVGMKRRYRV